MIAKRKISNEEMLPLYTTLFSHFDGKDRFKDITSGYTDVNMHICYLGWSDSMEPDEYLTVTPCK